MDFFTFIILTSSLAICNGGVFDEEWQSTHGMSCQKRLDKDFDIVEARSSECPVLEEGDITKINANCGNIHLCFRDDPPQSALAQKFRKFNCGMTIDKYYQATISPNKVDDTYDEEFISLLQDGIFKAGGSGTTQHYCVYNEGKANLPKVYPVPSYLKNIGDNGLGYTDYIPPEITSDNNGASQNKPIWETDGQYPINTMPDPDLLLRGTLKNPITPKMYKVPGKAIGTGSHTICAAFDFYACDDEFCDAEGSGDTWFLHYGGNENAMAWTSWGCCKWKIGPPERGGHLPYVHNALWGLAGDRSTFRKQLVCTVYDSFNKMMSMYVNGILFAEKTMNQYCYTMGTTWYVSNQYGDVINVDKAELHVGVFPRDLNSGKDFVGRFYFVGVWNEFNMDQRQACLMAGIKKDECPNVNVENTRDASSDQHCLLLVCYTVLLFLLLV